MSEQDYEVVIDVTVSYKMTTTAEDEDEASDYVEGEVLSHIENFSDGEVEGNADVSINSVTEKKPLSRPVKKD